MQDEYASLCEGRADAPAFCPDIARNALMSPVYSDIMSCMCGRAVHYSSDFSSCIDLCESEMRATLAPEDAPVDLETRRANFVSGYAREANPGTT